MTKCGFFKKKHTTGVGLGSKETKVTSKVFKVITYSLKTPNNFLTGHTLQVNSSTPSNVHFIANLDLLLCNVWKKLKTVPNLAILVSNSQYLNTCLFSIHNLMSQLGNKVWYYVTPYLISNTPNIPSGKCVCATICSRTTRQLEKSFPSHVKISNDLVTVLKNNHITDNS